MPSFTDRLQHAWNAFNNKDPTPTPTFLYGGSSYNLNRRRTSFANERSIINAIFNRIAVDAAGVDLRHVRLDENGRYKETINSGLNNCLSVEANVDQTGRIFIQDAIMSMFDEGVVALVPVDTTIDPYHSNAYDILSMRTGKIKEWMPKYVKIELYNEQTGRHEYVVMPKKLVAIVENPFYSIMNEPNSTLQRLIRKLNTLDAIDEQSGSGKLDLIIQLPYVVKSTARKQQAEERRKDIEMQLANSKYGIAYTDGTEKVTQLNRPVENNLMDQIKYLTETLMGQLGMTNEILNGTANEETMRNYYNRIIAVILTAFAEEIRRKFLTKTARSQGQSILFFQDYFKMVPMAALANIAGTLTQNAIVSANEMRTFIGLKPSEDPEADALKNRNINPVESQPAMSKIPSGEDSPEEIENQETQEESPLTWKDIPVKEILNNGA